MILLKKIGEKIKEARSIKGYSQKQLAEKLGITWEMLSKYENGRSNPINKIEELSYYLGKEIHYFFDFDNAFANNRIKNSGNTKNESSQIPLFESVLQVKSYIKSNLTPQLLYSVSAWAVRDFAQLFALKCINIKSDNIVCSDDIAIFSSDLHPSGNNYVLTEKGEIINRKDLKNKAIATLIYVEKRYVKNIL